MARVILLEQMVFEYIGTGIMLAYLRSQGHEVDHYVAGLEDEHGLAERVAARRPDLVLFATPLDFPVYEAWCARLCRELRTAACERLHIGAGGALFAMYPPHFSTAHRLLWSGAVDFVCFGEGERAIGEVARRIDAAESFADVPNLVVRHDGALRVNEAGPLEHDLGSLPLPARDLLYKYELLARLSAKTVMTGRGCRGACKFCFHHFLKGTVYGADKHYHRRVPAEHVLADIDNALRHDRSPSGRRRNTRALFFADDTFTSDVQWLEQFLPSYRREVGLPFTCEVRADWVTEAHVALLHEAGCRLVAFGVESGDEAYRRAEHGKNITDDKLARTAELLHRRGLPFVTYNILGAPGETARDVERTAALNTRLRPRMAFATVYRRLDALPAAAFATADPASVPKPAGPTSGPDDEVTNLWQLFYLLVKLPAMRPVLRWLAKRKPNAVFSLQHMLWSQVLFPSVFLGLRAAEIAKLLHLNMRYFGPDRRRARPGRGRMPGAKERAR